MLCAALAGYAACVHTGSEWLGFAAGMGAGAVLGAEFKVSPDLTVNLDAFHSQLKASYTNTRFFVRPGNSVAASGGVAPGTSKARV